MLDGLWLLFLGAVAAWGLWEGRSLVVLSSTLALLTSGSLLLWRRWCLAGVTYARHLSHDRAFFGQDVAMRVELLNLKPLPLTWLEVEDRFPRSLLLVGGSTRRDRSDMFRHFTMVVAMLPYERVVRKMTVKCNHRGQHEFGPTRLASGDYLGALVNYNSIPTSVRLLVFPKIMQLATRRPGSNQVIGPYAIRRLFQPDPIRIVGARDYLPGDPYRYIDWRASARRGSLMVRLTEPSTSPAAEVVIDFTVPLRGKSYYEMDELEFLLSAAASLIAYAVEQRWSVGLSGNGVSKNMPLALPPSRAPSRLGEMMEALAHASVVPSGPFADTLSKRHMATLSGVAFIVLTTNLSSQTLASLRELRRRGRDVTVIHAMTNEAVDAIPQHYGALPIWRIQYDKDWSRRETLVFGA